MKNQFRRLASWTLPLLLVPIAALQANEKPADTSETPTVVLDRFVRLERNEGGDVTALETAVVSYSEAESTERPVVDLIGAIHVGEKAYYEKLNRSFADYDVVLYELVAEEDQRPEPGRRGANVLTLMQVGMQSLLGLQFQLDCIDYSASNFVHADLSPDEFASSMSDRGESISQMFFRMMGQGMAIQAKNPSQSSDARLLAAFFSKDRNLQLKRVMAEQFEQSLGVPSVLEGPDGSTLITVRNRKAMDVLEEQLKNGKKRIGVFYGAAHLPDMENQLKERFQMEPRDTNWFTAWDMR